MNCYRIGNGVDIHPLVKGKKLILGGVHIENNFGCDGHSDGDVLVHSIIDSLLGALAKGDIGDYFPSSNQKWKDANSLVLLETIYDEQLGDWDIVNIDSTIILQAPIVKPYIEQMQENVNLGMTAEKISIKATTTDHLGFIGEGKGVAVITTCLLCNHK